MSSDCSVYNLVYCDFSLVFRPIGSDVLSGMSVWSSKSIVIQKWTTESISSVMMSNGSI